MEKEYEKRELLKALRSGRYVAARSKGFWREDEREDVNHRYLSGDGISDIALALQRDEGAIIQQLASKITPPGKHRKRKPKPPRCYCPCVTEKGCTYYEGGECKCCSNNTTRY